MAEACVRWALEGHFELSWDLGVDRATGRVGPWVVARVLPEDRPWRAGARTRDYRVEILLPGLMGIGNMDTYGDMATAIQTCSTAVSRWFREGKKGYSEASGGQDAADGGA